MCYLFWDAWQGNRVSETFIYFSYYKQLNNTNKVILNILLDNINRCKVILPLLTERVKVFHQNS